MLWDVHLRKGVDFRMLVEAPTKADLVELLFEVLAMHDTPITIVSVVQAPESLDLH